MRLAFGALLVACGNDVEAPWAPGLRRELTTYDYAVYSAWLVAQASASGGTVLVDG